MKIDMKNYLLFLLLFVSFTGIKAQQAFSLEEAVNYAVQNQNSIKLKHIEVSDANAQVKEYKSIGIPKLNAYVDYTRYIQIPTSVVPAEYFGGQVGEFAKIKFGTDNVLSGSLDFEALLFDGNYIQGLRAAKLYKILVAKDINVTVKQVKENVTKAYLAVLIAQENLSIIEKNITNVEKTLRETKSIYENGFAEQLDVDRLQLSVDNLVTEQQNIDQLIQISMNILKYQMGFPMNQTIALSEDLQTLVDLMQLSSVDLATEIQYTNRPEYDLLQASQDLNRVDLKRLKHGYLPSLKAFANHQQSLQRNELFNGKEPGLLPATLAGLRMSIPLFDGNEKKSQIQRVKLRMDKTAIQTEEFERGMELEVQNARIQLRNAQNTLRLREKSLALNEDIYNKSLIKFQEGVGSSVELRQAESSLYLAQSDYINSLYDLIIAKTNLDLAQGDLK
jgi:outer membrane protein TolC